jgi:hypothetical protein
VEIVVDPGVEDVFARVADAVGGGLEEVTEEVGPLSLVGGSEGEVVD